MSGFIFDSLGIVVLVEKLILLIFVVLIKVVINKVFRIMSKGNSRLISELLMMLNSLLRLKIFLWFSLKRCCMVIINFLVKILLNYIKEIVFIINIEIEVNFFECVIWFFFLVCCNFWGVVFLVFFCLLDFVKLVF